MALDRALVSTLTRSQWLAPTVVAVGYVIPFAVWTLFWVWVRNGPPGWHSYNYALPALLVLVPLPVFSSTCFCAGFILAVKSIRKSQLRASLPDVLAILGSSVGMAAILWIVAGIFLGPSPQS